MEYICELFDRKELVLNLFLDYNRTDHDYNFWEIVKTRLFDENLEMLEMIIKDTKNYNRPICCRACRLPLLWMHPIAESGDTDFESIVLKCICIRSKTIFKMNVTECCKTLLGLLDDQKVDPQMLATGLHLVLIAMESLSKPSPPIVPNDPVQTLLQISQEFSYMLKLGGKGNVIFAELYDNQDLILLKDDKLIKNFPILYIADTITVPTRFFLFPLKYKLNTTPEDYQTLLLNELISIANLAVKSESSLVLGSKIKEIITPDCYQSRAHTFVNIVTEDNILDADSNSTNVWDEIAKPILKLCSGINVLVANIEKTRNADEYYSDLKAYLNAAIWLKLWHNTPFETFLFAISNRTT